MSIATLLATARSTAGSLMRFKQKSIYSAHRIAVYLVTGFALVFFGFPIYWMFLSSLKPLGAITSMPPEMVPNPATATLSNYHILFFETRFLTWLLNSSIVALGVVVLSVFFSTLAGYALTRYRLPRKKWLAGIFILAYLFPPITLGIPFFIIFLNVGLINNLLAVILATTAFTLPFCTWLMWQFFQTVPISMEEAAWANGASRLRGIFEIAVPAAAPGIIACTIFAFAVGWNVFLFPYLFLQTPDQQVLTTGIFLWFQSPGLHWGALMAGVSLVCVPPLIVVLTLNRYIMEGFAIR